MAFPGSVDPVLIRFHFLLRCCTMLSGAGKPVPAAVQTLYSIYYHTLHVI